MKKLFLPILLLVSSLSFAQVCVPGAVTSPNNGYILPDSATNFSDACINQAYIQYVYIKAPKDTVLPVIGNAKIDSFVVNKNITGLPPGLMVESVPGFLPAAPGNPKTNFERLIIKGDSLACIKISGTVPTGTPVGTYNLSIGLRGYLKIAGGFVPLDSALNVNYYKIEVKNSGCFPASISNLEKMNFELIGNIPNPAHNYTNVVFESVNDENYTLKISNTLGAIVFEQPLKGRKGMNYAPINTTQFSKGMYLITLSNNKNSLTQKMLVD